MRWLDGLIDGQLQRLGYVKARSRVSLPAWLGGEAAGREWGLYWDDEGLLRKAMYSPWVISDVTLLANTIAGAKAEIVRRKGETTEPVPNHEFEKLMQRPNEFMSQEWLVKTTVWWLLLTGTAYWFLSPWSKTGGLAEIWPMNARKMRPIPDREEYIGEYKYMAQGREYRIPAEYVCYFRLFNPYDEYGGLSPLQAAQLGLESDYYAQAWNRNWYGQRNAIPTAVISLPQETTDTDFARIRDQIVKDFGGTERRAMITRAGDVDVKTISLTQTEMQFLGGREFTRDEIDRIFGVPPGIWAKDATQANALAADRTLKEKTVWPLLSYLCGEITAQVVQRFYGEDLEWQPEDIRPVDRALQVAEFRAKSDVLTVDEAREEWGHDKIGGAIGGMLVSELRGMTRATLFGANGRSNGSKPASAPTGDEIGETEIMKAMRRELRNWRGVALRAFRSGKNPADRDFDTNFVPLHAQVRLKAELAEATDEQAIKDLFEQAQSQLIGPDGDEERQPIRTDGPPLDDGTQFVVTGEEIEAAMADWRERHKGDEFEGILDAEPVGAELDGGAA